MNVSREEGGTPVVHKAGPVVSGNQPDVRMYIHV